MKKNFFTLLAVLMLVTVNAVAQTTENIKVGKVSAKTYVSSNDLDFKKMTNYEKNTEVQITPYYISYYSNGNFTLTRYPNGLVPKGYPMILYSKEGGGSFDVPIATTTMPTNLKKLVYTNYNGEFYLVPVIKGASLSGKVYPIEDPDAEEGYNFEFWSIPDGGSDFVTESTGEKYRLDGEVVLDAQESSEKTPMPIFETTKTRAQLTAAFGGDTYSYGDVSGIMGTLREKETNQNLADGREVGDHIIIYTPAYQVEKEYTYWDEDDEGNEIEITETIIKKYDAIYWYLELQVNPSNPTKTRWVLPSNKALLTYGTNNNVSGTLLPWDDDLSAWYTEKLNRHKNRYIQYILGANKNKAVFKKCPVATGNDRAKVAVGGCFIRVYAGAVTDAGEAREEIGFVFDEEEQQLQNEEATGIRNMKQEVINGTTIYNLNGQKLTKLQKGMNIVNGKKIFIR